MQYNNVIEVQFNWYDNPKIGQDFGFYRIGESYEKFRSGIIRCEDIEISLEDGLHAIIYFADGTSEHQWNLNKIIEAEKDVYDQAKKYHGNEQAPELPKPSTSQEKV